MNLDRRRSKIHYQHIVSEMLLNHGDISADDIRSALGMARDPQTRRRVQEALRQAVKRLRQDGWSIRTLARSDGGGYELISNPRTGAPRRDR